MPVLDLEARPEAVPLTRGVVRGLLAEWGVSDLRDDVDLVLSELLANAVLHAPGPARIVVERARTGVRLEVRDTSTTPPVRRSSGGSATTGRGLNLVSALCSSWGVLERDDGEPGKTVWCVVGGERTEELPEVDLDVEALLAAFDDVDDVLDAVVVSPRPDEPPAVVVDLGSAPVALLAEAKDHLDGVLREIALAESAGGLPQEVVEAMSDAVRRFAVARGQLRALLTAAAERGDARVDVVFRLPVELADRGEKYLDALRAADAFARDRRMLSLESPVEHRVLREWYVDGLVSGLRRAAAGLPQQPWEAFEARLLRRLHDLEQEQRAAQLGAQLQRVTAALAAAGSLDEIARAAVTEGVLALGADGGSLTRTEDGATAPVFESGEDVGLGARYLAVPVAVRPAGPSSDALRTATPVWMEGREDRDARYPHLAALQPAATAVAALPLVVAGDVVGALRYTWNVPHVFTDSERGFLTGLAAQTGQAVARADALQSLERLRDELERLLGATGRLSGTDLGVLRSLYQDAPVGIAVYDTERRFLRVNEVLARANGLSAADHVGRRSGELHGQSLAEPQRVRLRDALDRVLLEGLPVEEEIVDQRSGRARVWRTSWFPVRGTAGDVEAAVALAVDISAQRAAEERTRTLASLGDRLGREPDAPAVLDALADALVPGLADGVVVHLLDRRGRVSCALVRHVDAATQELLTQAFARLPVDLDRRHGAGRVLATGRTEVMPEADDAGLAALGAAPEAVPALRSALEGGPGCVVPLSAAGRTLGTLSVLRTASSGLAAEDLAVVEDVARRGGTALDGVQARATTQRLEVALEAAEVGSFEWHAGTGVLDGDARMFRLADLDAAAEPDLDLLLRRVLPDDAPRVVAALERVVAEVGELEVVCRVRTAGDGLRWVEARGRALPGADGTTARVVGTAVDVSERYEGGARAERPLELMGDAFLSLDRQWRVTYLNREAERVLDRPRESLLGRVLWDEFPEAVGTPFEQEYRRAVATGEPAVFEQWFAPLGRHFEVRAHAGPDGLSVYFSDVSTRRAAERQRDRALERLSMLDAIGAALTETLDVDEALSRLADLLVPSLADLVSIDLRDSGEVQGARAVVTVAADPAKAAALVLAEEVLPRRHNPGSAVHQVLHGSALVHLVVTPEHLAGLVGSSGQLELYLQIDMRHAVVVPLVARGRVFGAISLIRTGPDAAPFTDGDRALAQDVGRRAGLMVDNAAQYTAQRSVAEQLQRSLLPDLPLVPGLVLGAAYEPSSTAAMVGGDWYDAFVLPDGGVGLVIGDVMGHDIAAAAAMGQLRSVLRTCAADGDPPALVLDRLDRLVSSFAMADLATVVYARIDHRADGTALLTWANAGHPPPLVLAPDGTTSFLDEGRSVMIGAPSGESRGQAERVLAPGSTLLLFTDGLVERRGCDLDDQLDGLARTASGLAGDGPDALCRRLLATVRRDADTDDAAAIAVTLV